MIYTAIYDYQAQTDQELSIKTGDVLILTDNTDPEWWTVTLKSHDTFQQELFGFVPSTYIEPAPHISIYTVLYDYQAQTNEELTVREGQLFYLYDQSDPDWWWGVVESQVGLVPCTYLQVGQDENSTSREDPSMAEPIQETTQGDPSPSTLNPLEQKNKLLNALDGFGFANPVRRDSIPKQNTPSQESPSYLVTEIEKKKKKKGFLTTKQDFIVFLDEKTRSECYSIPIHQVVYSEKKLKKFYLEWQGEVREYEADKSTIQNLMNLFDEFVGNSTQVSAHQESVVSDQVQVLSQSQGPPKIAIALYDYTEATEGELSIKENENVLVLDDSDPDWWFVRCLKKGGGEGFVPRTYLELKQARLEAFPVSPIQSSLPLQQSSIPSPLQHKKEEATTSKQTEEEEEEARIQKQEEAKRLATWKMLEEQRLKMESDLKAHDEELKRQQEVTRQVKEQEEAKKKMELEEIRLRLQQDELKRRQEQEQLLEMTRRAALEADKKARDQLEAKMAAPAIAPRPVQPVQVPLPATVPLRTSSLETPSIPARPSLPPSVAPRPIVPQGRPEPTPKRVPNKANMRLWSDKTGSIKVEAEYLHIKDNKVHLLKEGGTEIAVLIDKLLLSDVEYLSTLPNNEFLKARAPPARPKRPSHVDSSILAQAEAIKPPPPTGNFVYNGFNWKDWLIQAGVSPGDAFNYAPKFVSEKLDESCLVGIQRETLRSIGVSEGDIIRIKNVIMTSSNSTTLSLQEKEALERNISKIHQSNQQVLSDEEFARKLQMEEMGVLDSNSKKASTRRPSSNNNNTVDLKTIQQASNILEASSGIKGSSSSGTIPTGAVASVLRKSSLNNSNGNDSLKSFQKPSSDPWMIPSSNTPLVRPSTTAVRPLVDPSMTPLAQEALVRANKQQKEAQLALQKAQEDIKNAQEQARQAAIIQEQTKKAQAQEAQAAAALMQAQETAKQAALMKQQAEQALMNAKAGLVAQQRPSTSPMPSQYSSSSLTPMGGLHGMTMGPPQGMNPQIMNRPLRPNLPPPLIPLNKPPSFVPIGGPPPQQLQQPMYNPPLVSQVPNNSDPYSVFRNVDLSAPSVFNSSVSQMQPQPVVGYGNYPSVSNNNVPYNNNTNNPMQLLPNSQGMSFNNNPQFYPSNMAFLNPQQMQQQQQLLQQQQQMQPPQQQQGYQQQPPQGYQQGVRPGGTRPYYQ